MRQAVKLYGYQFDPYGELDRSESNSKVIRLCNIDLTNAVSETDYDMMTQTTSSFRGKTVRVIDFRLLSGHYDRLTGYDISGKFDILPRWECVYDEDSAEYQFSDCANFDAVPIGEKPADWELRWRDKYYTIYTQTFTYNSRTYKIRAPKAIQADTEGSGTGWDTATWNATTQYYKPKAGHEPQKMWFTERLLCVSGSNMYETNGFSRFDNFGVLIGKRSRGRYYKDGSNLNIYSYLSRTNSFCTLNQSTKKLTGTPTWNINTWQLIWGASYTPLAEQNTTAAGFMTLCSFQFNGVDYVGIVFINRNITTGVVNGVNVFAMEDLPDENESPWGVEPPLPPSGGGYSGPTSSPGGGSGTYTDTDSGIIRTAINGTLFTGSVSGGFKTYDIDSTILNKVINGIFSGTYSEKMVNQMNTGIVDCYGLAIPASSAGSVNISVLGEDIEDGGNVMEAPIISPMQEFVSCGSISLGKFYDSFLDFDPFTTLSIYLPFIGKFDLPTNEFMYATLTLKYIQDNYSGDLLAIIEASGDYKYTGVDGHGTSYAHPVAEFSGNGKYTIPINVASKNNIALLSTLSAGGKIVGGVVTGAKAGGALGPEGAAIGAIVGGAAGAIASYPDLVATGSAPLTGHSLVQFSGNQSWLSCMTPYIVITRSMYAEPSTFGNDVGYRSNISYRIGDISGWTICKNADLSGITNANDHEKAEILALIKSGIYVGGSI